MIEEELNKFIYEWVKKNFGESEADDPSWSIEALAHDLAEEYYKIKESEELDYIKEDIKYVADNHEIELTAKQLDTIAQEYRYSEAYCAMDTDSILYFIERYKGE